MYFPMYLLLDFGVLGWLAFAVPNVVGAMMVGLIWKRTGDSERFVQKNRSSMRLFSIATVLFHIGFLGWLLESRSLAMFDDYAYGAVVMTLLMIASMLLGALGSRGWVGLAVVVLLASVAAIVATSMTSMGMGVRDPRDIVPNQSVIALALASPALAMGFLLCPHLDLTIHRARQEALGATGTAAFVIGFGVLFLVMIVFTLFYGAGILGGSWSYYVIAHIAIQSTFTMGAHMRELYEHGVVFGRDADELANPSVQRRRSAITTALSTLAIIVAVLVGIALVERWVNDWIELPTLEAQVRQDDASIATQRFNPAPRSIYQSYLSLYALVFPAWLWIGVLRGRGLGAPARLAFWLFSVVAAGPLFAWGYLGERFGLI
ncbi:MAG: hypothetical protein ACYTF7_12065, partial [Planctomycetota bacterium]